MSSENRYKVLLGFGALAVIVIVAIVLWPPNFRKEDASGAIGQVQKHRAPQITQKDVILGSEAVRHRQKIRYQDFLADASKLKAIGNNPAELNAFELELSARYTAEAAEALAMEEVAARTDSHIKGDVDQLASFLGQHTALNDEAMQQFNVKLKEIEQASARTGAMSLAEVDQELASVASKLKSVQLDNADQLAGRLKDISDQLNSESLFAVSLADEADYLAQVEMEAKTASAHLGDEAMAHKLSEVSDQLMAKAQKNIEADFLMESDMAARLKDMDEQLATANHAANQASMVNSASLAASLKAVSQALARCDNQFRENASLAVAQELNAVQALDNAGKLSNSQLEGRMKNFEAEMAANKKQ